MNSKPYLAVFGLFLSLFGIVGCDVKRDNVIPGMEAVDVYLNLEQKGFVVTKDANVSQVTCRSGRYTAEVFGLGSQNVTFVRLTIMAPDDGMYVPEDLDLMGYIASVPYDGADRAANRAWARENFDVEAERDDGIVRMETKVSPGVRMLIIRKAGLNAADKTKKPK